MTPDRKRLVRESWARVEPVGEMAAALFYGRLFELDPALRHLFHGDVEWHGRKLMQTLAQAVRGLDGGAPPCPPAEGARGAQDDRYETVARALFWMLERVVGEGFSPAVRDAWAEAYARLATAMQRSGAGVPGLPSPRRVHPASTARAVHAGV